MKSNMVNNRGRHSYVKNQEIKQFSEMLPVSINNIGGKEIQAISAKKLYEYLKVRRDFTTWLKDRIKKYGFVENSDYIVLEGLNTPKQGSVNNTQFSPKQGKTSKGGRPGSDYIISLNMAKELSMVERNEQGKAARLYFIECEEALQRIAPKVTQQLRNKLQARIKAANYHKPMCAALELARAEQGKKTDNHHYSTESNMLNRMVLGGLTAKQWAKVNHIAGQPRDSMNQLQLEHLSYLEQSNITLIELGLGYHERKAKLTGFSQRWLAKRMDAK
ncbi:antA/AntB antirepressor family protein [Xenorhabdus budapestensis]|uniref:AntA/AntB antirepressor family protein n=1 Tax=Xenorhabdus budapestensis TaxID=290110 RepID=A0A2D0IRS7_XENBU|nr:antA/AntB antirepressor family protein [Xenorhabdus budapestensis]PHM24549.1 antA/AntB antirepressor family protein [Xenorhabdus budapestensis]QTL40756.1 antA/AntB antirepressor family protein [Xenorhabdus budapestensis]